MNFAIFSDRFGLIMKKVACDIAFFSSEINEILLSLLYKKNSENFLEKNFVYGKISEFLLDFLLDSHGILRLKI